MQAEQANRDLLQSLEGKPFEEMYLSNQLAGHDMVLGMLDSAKQQFATSDILPLLKNLEPTIREHRSHAYRLLSEQKAPMRQARTPATGR
jgi:putative membrane protein